MWVIKYKWLFFVISGLLVAGSLFSLWKYGLKLGTDFTGGTILEVQYQTARPEIEVIKQKIASLNLGQVAVQPAGDADVILRLRTISDAEHTALLAALPNNPLEKRFSSIGPAVGAELAQKGLLAIAIVVVLIILFITIAFWGVSRPVASWKYGLIAVATLVHDLAIPAGVFSYLGYTQGKEVDALFLTALLTILGLSVNDTIVVFDRIRENLRKKVKPHFEEIVGQSLTETFVRSLNTSLTVILVLLCVYFFGGPTTRDFALVLTIGMIVGTYSSIFIASPLLVVWEKWVRRWYSLP